MELDHLDNQLLAELYLELDSLMNKFAYNPHWTISGFEREDLKQEMRIKVWKVVSRGKYDPTRCKPTTFFYRVFYRVMLDLKRKHVYGRDILSIATSLGQDDPENVLLDEELYGQDV